eukprot:scaffold97550_cov43-Phaeocystis_antarctica.AAC.1
MFLLIRSQHSGSVPLIWASCALGCPQGALCGAVNFNAVCACYGPGASVTEQIKASRTCLQLRRASPCKESNVLCSKPGDL